MRIAESAVNLQSNHEASLRREVRQSLETWAGPSQPEGMPESSPLGASSVEILISDAGYHAAGTAYGAPEAVARAGDSDALEADPRLSLVKALVEMLTGKQIKELPVQMANGNSLPAGGFSVESHQSVAGSRSQGRGIRLDYREIREETELTSFRAQGSVRTSDGREIAFDFGLSMSRSYREESSISLRRGDARQQDPLVIGLDGSVPKLSSATFRFDLNGDGKVEDVPTFSSGTGYLALDLNGNGVVDNGQELFGPATGNGFLELAAYDEDRNGWIDEGDSVFGKLRVWQPTPEGAGGLTSLGDLGVGALALAAVETPFQFRSASNDLLGTARASSIYLAENGTAGSLQQIDLVA
jgi:hypothetical protein